MTKLAQAMTAAEQPSPYPHLMLDIETLGVSMHATVVSIGAVGFDPVTSEMDDEGFYSVIDLRVPPGYVQPHAGQVVRVETATLLWWMQQGDEARAVFSDMDKRGVPAQRACLALDDYIGRKCVTPRSLKVWSHGAGFDIPILRELFARERVPWPCDFRCERDTRTLFDLTGIYPSSEAGTRHNALDDAKAQAIAVVQSYSNLQEIVGAANAWARAQKQRIV